MDYLKYYKLNEYELGKNDCWTFTQLLFKNEKGITLPDLPIINNTTPGFLKENIKHKKLDKAHFGCLIYVPTRKNGHSGFALDAVTYFHKIKNSVRISNIPESAEIYEILND